MIYGYLLRRALGDLFLGPYPVWPCGVPVINNVMERISLSGTSFLELLQPIDITEKMTWLNMYKLMSTRIISIFQRFALNTWLHGLSITGKL
jgi:hypothetical protein